MRQLSKNRRAKARQAAKLAEIREALIAAGCDTTAKQASVLGVGRSTAWALLNLDKSAARPGCYSAKETPRMPLRFMGFALLKDSETIREDICASAFARPLRLKSAIAWSLPRFVCLWTLRIGHQNVLTGHSDGDTLWDRRFELPCGV